MIITFLFSVGIAAYAIRVLWVYFVAGMRLKQVRDAGALTPAMKMFGYVSLAEGLVLDFLVHMVIGTLLFLEWPARKEYTLSARLWRLSNGPPGWRQRLALAIRVGLLDAIDPRGYHRG